MRLKALIFDVDGTLAETEETHRAAFNQAFDEAGLDWIWSQDQYRLLLGTTGGRERIARHRAEHGLAPDAAQIVTLHERKNAIYADLIASGATSPRPGIAELIAEARRKSLVLAIATTTSRVNLAALLRHGFGKQAARWFEVIVAGEDVAAKKPDPEVYRRVLAALALSPTQCVAIEDSRNGLDAARAAGIATVVTPSLYSGHERFDGAALVIADPRELSLDRLDTLLEGSG